MRWILSIICLLFCLVAGQLFNDIYISDEYGDDDTENSHIIPFKTINKAVQAAIDGEYKNPTFKIYEGYYNIGYLFISQLTTFDKVEFIGLTEGVHINGTINTEKYISLTLKNVILFSDKSLMDLNNIRSLSILDSHVEGFILSMPHYLNRKLEINIINNTFYNPIAKDDTIVLIMECFANINIINNIFVNTTLTLKRRCLIHDIDPTSNITIEYNKFHLPKYKAFLEHVSSGSIHLAISYLDKDKYIIKAHRNFWQDKNGPSICSNKRGNGTNVGLYVDYSLFCEDFECTSFNKDLVVDLVSLREGCIQVVEGSHKLMLIISSFICIILSIVGFPLLFISYSRSSRTLENSMNFLKGCLILGIFISIFAVVISYMLVISMKRVHIEIHATRMPSIGYISAMIVIFISVFHILLSLFIIVLTFKEKNGFIIFHKVLKPYFVIMLVFLNIVLLKIITESAFYSNFYIRVAYVKLSKLTYFTFASSIPLLLSIFMACLSSWKVKEHIFKSDIKKIKEHIRQNYYLVSQEEMMQKSPEFDKAAKNARISIYTSLFFWILLSIFSFFNLFSYLNKDGLLDFNILYTIISFTGVILLFITVYVTYRYHKTSSILSILLSSMFHTTITQSLLIFWILDDFKIRDRRRQLMYMIGTGLTIICIITKIVDSIYLYILRQKVSNGRYRLILNKITAIEQQTFLNID